ncbi:MAG: hypothetical protein WC076_02775 [Terrimicrobiaceae bacterium]
MKITAAIPFLIRTAAVLLLGNLPSLSAATFFYTYGTEAGGVASLVASPEGQISAHEALPGAGLKQPRKLAISGDGKRILVTSEASSSAWLISLAEKSRKAEDGLRNENNAAIRGGGNPFPHRAPDSPIENRQPSEARPTAKGSPAGVSAANQSAIENSMSLLMFDEPTSDVQPYGDHALVMADKGFIYWFDFATGQTAQTWNARKGLTPSGNKGEDILFLPDQNMVLVSFQKDSKKGEHKGSRLVLLDMETFTPKADLQLPREYPSLNIPKNKKEQGPNPEMMFPAPKSNTLAVSLDLYGAVAFADLDAALNGEWKNLAYVPSSPDGAWGTAFPDRGTLLDLGGKEYLLIANASENGGLVLFDVAARKIVQTFPAEAGAETPIYLPKAKKVVTVISGKMKQRTKDGLEKDIVPGNDLLVLDVAQLESAGKATLQRLRFDTPLVKVEAIDPETSSALLLVNGKNEFLTYDLAARKILAREPAKGPVNRVAVWRGKAIAR